MTTKFLHLTSNLGSLFDEQVIEDRWLSELSKLITSEDRPGVVAIHCQEIGGKDFEENMSKVENFIQNLKDHECFTEYSRFRAYVDTGHTDTSSFTALGSFYFIHKSVQSVSLWNFKTHKFEEVVGDMVCTETPAGSFHKLSSDVFHSKTRFPNNYFPNIRWSRKGFLHTKWRIDSLIVNMVNIHMFHDEDNLVALEKSPSDYCQYRQKALNHTLEHLSKTVHGLSPESNFIFGDFNFRLDLSCVVKHLTSSEHHPQFIRGEDGELLKVMYRSTMSSGDNDDLCIERRKFFLNSHVQLFKNSSEELLQFDNELKNFQSSLKELPINFPPSYPFSEDIDRGDDYMNKRCPAWCDRVLLNQYAMDLVKKSPVKPVYQMLSPHLCVGDHKPIYLLYTVNTSPSEERASKKDTNTGQQQAQNDVLMSVLHQANSYLPVLISSFLPNNTTSSTISTSITQQQHITNNTGNIITRSQVPPAVGFDPSALTPDNLHSIPGLAYYSGSAVDPKVGTPGGADKNSTSKDGKKEKKGRATFSGNQIDELEKVFNTNQYLTNQERHNLAERLSLSENQVKIWFQNRRTKCRRTSWKRPSSVTSPTTPTAPVSFGSTPTTPTQQNPPNPPPSTQ